MIMAVADAVGLPASCLFISRLPEKSIGGKAYDSGRKLRRHKRRWKVEGLSAWLQNFRRLAGRHECHADNFLAFLQLACSVIRLRFILR